MASKRRLKPNGQLEPMSKDDEYPIHNDNIAKMTAAFAKLHPEKTTKKVNKNLANQLLAFGILVKPPSEQRPAFKKYYRLEHATAENMCGSIHGPDSTPYEGWHDHKQIC